MPTLARVAAERQTKWQEVTVHDWYGAPQRVVEVATWTPVWYHAGMPAVPIRWVVIRDPQEKFATQALLSTKLEVTPQQVLEWFVRRWQMEVTFEEARAHLGMETQRQWSEKAIARTAAQRAVVARPPRGVVRQTACDLFGHACVCAALVVESATFSDVEHRE